MGKFDEIIYLSKIVYSNQKTYKKIDFEKVCDVPVKNHSFRIWLNSLVQEGLIIYKDNFFIPVKKQIMKKIESFPEGQVLRFVFFRHYEGWY